MADRKLSLIGVAGSRGKTTFSHLLRHLLANAGNDCGMLSTIENDFGGRIMPSHQTTAEAIDLAGYFARMVEYGCKSAIVEISPTAIMQGRTLGLDFEAAIFTNLIAQCGQEEAVYGLWKKFFDGSLGSRPKTAIINLDDPYGQRLHGEIHEHVETITYGTLPACDIRVEEMAGNKSGVAFKFRLGNRRYNATLPMIGEMNVMNALGTMAVAYSLGENVKDSAACLADFAGVPGRLERINMGQPFEVVVDYAHTEESLKNTLAELRKITAGRIATVFGCGGGHSADKRGSITRAVMTGSDLTIATADNPRLEKISEIFKMMQAGIVEGKSIEFVEDRREAIGKAINAARTGDCVLIAGKGHEATQEMGGRIVPFDDRTVAKEMLRGILTKQS
jgi:UDP-N-acetylmuramoyl-L-alanyl-D-glutamate--2,6-diaminopimelate ligase